MVAALALLSFMVSAPNADAAGERAPKEPSVAAKRTNAKPDPNAPTLEMVPDDGKDRESTNVTGLAAAYAWYLPFNFNFDFSVSLASRSFWPSYNGQACVNLRGTGSTDPLYYTKEIKVEMWDSYGTDTRIGLPVRYSLDGNYYGYCFTGLNPYHEHYFKLTKDWGPTNRVWGNGWAAMF